MHVRTDAGVEGMCTVGDVRYRVMSERALAQLRALVIGEDALDRERLDAKLRRAARFAFLPPGWAGAFDNCLWDIAGKVAGKPVCELLGRERATCPAYYNSGGGSLAEAVEDSRRAVSLGFTAVKDHFAHGAAENARWFAAVREALGPEVALMHDAAGEAYTWAEAEQVGRGLEDLGFLWFEEPLSDRDQAGLQRLCHELNIPVAGAETLMHDLVRAVRPVAAQRHRRHPARQRAPRRHPAPGAGPAGRGTRHDRRAERSRRPVRPGPRPSLLRHPQHPLLRVLPRRLPRRRRHRDRPHQSAAAVKRRHRPAVRPRLGRRVGLEPPPSASASPPCNAGRPPTGGVTRRSGPSAPRPPATAPR